MHRVLDDVPQRRGQFGRALSQLKTARAGDDSPADEIAVAKLNFRTDLNHPIERQGRRGGRNRADGQFRCARIERRSRCQGDFLIGTDGEGLRPPDHGCRSDGRDAGEGETHAGRQAEQDQFGSRHHGERLEMCGRKTKADTGDPATIDSCVAAKPDSGEKLFDGQNLFPNTRLLKKSRFPEREARFTHERLTATNSSARPASASRDSLPCPAAPLRKAETPANPDEAVSTAGRSPNLSSHDGCWRSKSFRQGCPASSATARVSSPSVSPSNPRSAMTGGISFSPVVPTIWSRRTTTDATMSFATIRSMKSSSWSVQT